ncbi:hypothetical protein [Nonomuraea basaltis]|uniref:hypothetical protein n=1 Tax=Nonomuraea basaltis TaxID=2495887 RepID=UPI00110C49B0|nr:hypothetical protein [Nonomuraea basaltis]TMR89012.1 hypothetical protein EJK15_63095 [Nonomuraea basaltis]
MLLAFEGGLNEEGLPIDYTSQDRQQVLHDLIREPGPADLDFARYLLAQEIHSHRRSWGFCHSIELAVLLVAEHRQVEDVWLLHEAVYASIDTWGILPHRLLYAAGIERTRHYVATSDHPRQDARRAALDGPSWPLPPPHRRRRRTLISTDRFGSACTRVRMFVQMTPEIDPAETA